MIHQYRKEYPIRAMCAFFSVSRSGYYRYVQHLDAPEKDAGIAEMIRQCHRDCGRTYGYRRVKIWLEREKGICLNEKTVLRIMRAYGLLSEIRRRKGYRRAMDHLHRYPNLLNRDFHAQRPNQKWVTDISYIQTGEGCCTCP
ncbi:MAG: IS3 family transposase [Oscillospiraceae bacterium]